MKTQFEEDNPVRAFARKLLGIRCAVRRRCDIIGITIEGDRRNGNAGTFGKSLFLGADNFPASDKPGTTPFVDTSAFCRY